MENNDLFLIPALETAIAVLQQRIAEVRRGSKPSTSTPTRETSTRPAMSEEAREKIRQAQKARWAAAKKTPAPVAKKTAKTKHAAPKATTATPGEGA